MVNNLGGSGHPGLEQVWDTILSRGILLYGIATDDAHEFKKLDNLQSLRLGMGWVVVRAAKLEARPSSLRWNAGTSTPRPAWS